MAVLGVLGRFWDRAGTVVDGLEEEEGGSG